MELMIMFCSLQLCQSFIPITNIEGFDSIVKLSLIFNINNTLTLCTKLTFISDKAVQGKRCSSF